MNKFRIYDKLKNEYVTTPQYHCIGLDMDGVLFMCNFSGKSYESYLPIDITHYIIEWCTGLVDCKGVEIYVGDFMCLTHNGIPTAEIVFEKFGGFSFKWINETFRFVRLHNTEPIFRNIALFEVIGNIHQTPTL